MASNCHLRKEKSHLRKESYAANAKNCEIFAI
jgi:hypothetical protein